MRRFRRQVETSLSSDGQRLAAFSTALEEALQVGALRLGA